MPRSSRCLPIRACGARPSAARPSGGKGAWLASPGMASKAVFSEGRTLCVRLAWPNVCRGISFPPACAGEKPGHPRKHASVKPGPPLRACGARPFAGRPSGGKGAWLASPGMASKAVFSEGRTLCVRLAWPNVCRGIPFSRDGRAKPGHPRGHASIKPGLSLRACGARPSRRGDRK